LPTSPLQNKSVTPKVEPHQGGRFGEPHSETLVRYSADPLARALRVEHLAEWMLTLVENRQGIARSGVVGDDTKG
jgi:hypothetical protein